MEVESWAKLRFLGAPWCACCGFPFETAAKADDLCAACIAEPPDFDVARAALAYDALSARFVLDLKRSGRRDGLATFAGWMRAAARPELATADLVIPAPLHWRRLAQRGFNQAVWLGHALAKLEGRPFHPAVLDRVKARRSQEGLNAAQRRRNVTGAYRVARGRGALVAGRRILLVDDVYTTGATVNACARALKRAGAAAVSVVTLARVVRPLDVTI